MSAAQTRFEYVVVGGGVVGVTAAFWLSRSGASVALVEQGALASGASGGAGKRGFRRCSRDMRELRFAAEAVDRWTEIADEIGGGPLIDHIGGMVLTNVPLDGSLGGTNQLHVAELQNRFGIRTEVLTREEVVEREPSVGGDTIGALYVHDDGAVDHAGATRRVGLGAAALGAELFLSETVTAVIPDGSATRVRTASGLELTATRAVVLAANGPTAGLLEPILGWRLPIWESCGQMVIVRKTGMPVLNGLLNHTTRPISIKAVGDDQWMLSGGGRGHWDPVTRTGTPIAAVTQARIDQALVVTPGIEGAEVVEADASRTDSWVPDGVAILDRIETEVPVYAASSFSGHGFAIAPAATRHLTDWMMTGERPAVLDSFRIARFRP